MKVLRLIVTLGIFAILFSFVPAASAGAPPGNWVSGIACQNLSDTDAANITLYFYLEGQASSVYQYTDPNPVPPGDTRNYWTPDSPPGVPEGFLGSVVVASNTPMACNVNTQTASAGSSSDPYRIGTSAGFADTETAPKMYAPQVEKNYSGWSSYIAVQNTSTSETTVTITYKDRFGNNIPAATETEDIPGQSNHVFYQSDNANLPNSFFGSAEIAAGDNTSGLAATINLYNSGGSSGTAQFLSYNGFGSGANKLMIPRIVRNYAGYNGGISIQNIGTSPTTVKITFNFFGNTYTYNSPNIQPGAALALYAPDIDALDPVDSLPSQQRYGNAVVEVTSGGPIVAIVNEDNRGGSGVPAERVGQGSTYNAIPDGSQSNTLFYAQIPRKAGGIFSGGFQFANTTSTAGTCDITFNEDPNANIQDKALPKNGTLSFYGPDVTNLNDGYNNSVTVVCTQPVVGIANLAAEPGSGKYGDSFTTSNGLNR